MGLNVGFMNGLGMDHRAGGYKKEIPAWDVKKQGW
jgi:hypothetical protein